MAGLVASTWSTDASAAPARGEGIHQGGFIYGSPGVVVIPVDEDDFFDLDPTWGWSFGGGYLFAPGRLFKAQVGGAFEHTILNPDDFDADGRLNMIRIMPEARIGAGTQTVWGYGLIGTGLGITVWDDRDDFDDDDDAVPGFVLQLGGGVQGAVWRSLVLGGELDFDLGFFDDNDDRYWRNDDDFEIHQMTIKFIIGWYF